VDEKAMGELMTQVEAQVPLKFPLDWGVSGGRYVVHCHVEDLPRLYLITTCITQTNRRWFNTQIPLQHTHAANHPTTLENEVNAWANWLWDTGRNQLTREEWRYERCDDPEVWPAELFPHLQNLKNVREAMQRRKDAREGVSEMEKEQEKEEGVV
jgi:hypothetical protein